MLSDFVLQPFYGFEIICQIRNDFDKLKIYIYIIGLFVKLEIFLLITLSDAKSFLMLFLFSVGVIGIKYKLILRVNFPIQ